MIGLAESPPSPLYSILLDGDRSMLPDLAEETALSKTLKHQEFSI